ncbi:inheritance of peroxisomes protein 1-domain-containing protein [Pyronema domesticum]|nr:inheritance of peroxisomes protein 1-domain-containing protein [Pyronema domesticum]
MSGNRQRAYSTTAAGQRRNFSAPVQTLQELKGELPTGNAASAEHIQVLFAHSESRIVSFTFSTTTILAGQPLPWKSPIERTIASGPLRIYKTVPHDVAFLQSGPALKPLLSRTQCWNVDGKSTFCLKLGNANYWRIEILGLEVDQDAKCAEFRAALSKIVAFEVTASPFIRGEHTPVVPSTTGSIPAAMEPVKVWRRPSIVGPFVGVPTSELLRPAVEDKKYEEPAQKPARPQLKLDPPINLTDVPASFRPESPTVSDRRAKYEALFAKGTFKQLKDGESSVSMRRSSLSGDFVFGRHQFRSDVTESSTRLKDSVAPDHEKEPFNPIFPSTNLAKHRQSTPAWFFGDFEIKEKPKQRARCGSPLSEVSDASPGGSPPGSPERLTKKSTELTDEENDNESEYSPESMGPSNRQSVYIPYSMGPSDNDSDECSPGASPISSPRFQVESTQPSEPGTDSESECSPDFVGPSDLARRVSVQPEEIKLEMQRPISFISPFPVPYQSEIQLEIEPPVSFVSPFQPEAKLETQRPISYISPISEPFQPETQSEIEPTISFVSPSQPEAQLEVKSEQQRPISYGSPFTAPFQSEIQPEVQKETERPISFVSPFSELPQPETRLEVEPPISFVSPVQSEEKLEAKRPVSYISPVSEPLQPEIQPWIEPETQRPVSFVSPVQEPETQRPVSLISPVQPEAQLEVKSEKRRPISYVSPISEPVLPDTASEVESFFAFSSPFSALLQPETQSETQSAKQRPLSYLSPFSEPSQPEAHLEAPSEKKRPLSYVSPFSALPQPEPQSSALPIPAQEITVLTPSSPITYIPERTTSAPPRTPSSRENLTPPHSPGFITTIHTPSAHTITPLPSPNSARYLPVAPERAHLHTLLHPPVSPVPTIFTDFSNSPHSAYHSTRSTSPTGSRRGSPTTSNAAQAIGTSSAVLTKAVDVAAATANFVVLKPSAFLVAMMFSIAARIATRAVQGGEQIEETEPVYLEMPRSVRRRKSEMERSMKRRSWDLEAGVCRQSMEVKEVIPGVFEEKGWKSEAIRARLEGG